MTTDDVSKRVYEEELRDWLPDRIIDCHVHISHSEFTGEVSPERHAQIWAMEVAPHEPTWELLRTDYQTLFPGKELWTLAFGNVYREVDIEANNDYVLAGGQDPVNKARVLAVTRPEWDAERIVELLQQGFLGIKPYPDLAPAGMENASIYDFLPREHLAAADEAGAIVMLHLPRPARLGDPENVKELLEIHESYPAVKLIVAHIGRSYCLPTAQSGLPALADAKGIYFDTAANLNADVFAYALETIGQERILFGSDLPVMLMLGVREHVGEKYINYTDGDYSWNTNRKSPEEEANYTYFLYEELRAIKDAIKRTGLGEEAVQRVFYSNCADLLGLNTQ